MNLQNVGNCVSITFLASPLTLPCFVTSRERFCANSYQAINTMNQESFLPVRFFITSVSRFVSKFTTFYFLLKIVIYYWWSTLRFDASLNICVVLVFADLSTRILYFLSILSSVSFFLQLWPAKHLIPPHFFIIIFSGLLSSNDRYKLGLSLSVLKFHR